jgi:uncharacterized coiled-coil DUF342 family protein
MRTGSLKGGFGEAEKSEIAVDEVRELRERVHLLTEENHVLFEQITLLRSHYDKYNEEVNTKINEAQYKTQAYDLLHADFLKLSAEKEELHKANVYLDN